MSPINWQVSFEYVAWIDDVLATECIVSTKWKKILYLNSNLLDMYRWKLIIHNLHMKENIFQ